MQLQSSYIEELLQGLRTISRTDIGWRGHQTASSDDVYVIFNQLIYLLKNTLWEVDQRSATDLKDLLKEFKDALTEVNDSDSLVELKADCKMRKAIEYRLEQIHEIINRASKSQNSRQVFGSIMRLLEEIIEENQFLLQRSQNMAENYEWQDGPFPNLQYEELSPTRNKALHKINLQKEQSNRRMVILLVQNLLGNAYEITDNFGNKILEKAFSQMDPSHLAFLGRTLNKNYRKASTDEIRTTAMEAINLIKKGFSYIEIDIPDHIVEQIEELREALNPTCPLHYCCDFKKQLR